jgi:hypothetical protein
VSVTTVLSPSPPSSHLSPSLLSPYLASECRYNTYIALRNANVICTKEIFAGLDSLLDLNY